MAHLCTVVARCNDGGLHGAVGIEPLKPGFIVFRLLGQLAWRRPLAGRDGLNQQLTGLPRVRHDSYLAGLIRAGSLGFYGRLWLLHTGHNKQSVRQSLLGRRPV